MVSLSGNIHKETAFQEIQNFLQSLELNIHSQDDTRPWGGFFVIQESSLETFIQSFFPTFHPRQNGQKQKLSPKILAIEPGKRLSWQYHHRRSELWKVLHGPVGVILSDDNSQNNLQTLETSETISIDCGKRHRLVGLKNWAIVAEIWNHIDPSHPSSEDDIVRLDDDYGRIKDSVAT